MARWRYWLLPILMMGMIISIFEVNTEVISNSWGDQWDTYLPAEFTRDQSPSTTTSPNRVTGAFVMSSTQRVGTRHIALTKVSSRQYCWLWHHRLFLRCCQWRI